MRARLNSAGRKLSDCSADDQAGDSLLPRSISAKRVLPLASFFQCEDVAVTRLAMELHTAQPGDLVCFQTGKHDPVCFASTALAHGAAAVLTEQLLPCPLPQIVVGDVQDAACRIVAAVQEDPATQLLTIGVVGNGGKTSTALLIAGLLKQLGIRTAYETDLGYSDGVVQSVPTRPLCSGAALIELLAEAREAGCEAMVIEYGGNQPGASSGLKLDVLVITGEYFPGHAGAAAGYFGPDPLAIALEQVKDDAVVILPAEHPKLTQRVAESGLRQLTYGLRRPADIAAKIFDEQIGESTLMVTCGDETAVMRTPHCGESMLANHLAAIALGQLLEMRLTEAIAAVGCLPMIPGRMQRFGGDEVAAVMIDAASTPEQLAAALRSLRRQLPARGKLWCLLSLPAQDGEGSELLFGRDDQLARSGQLVQRFAHHVILTSSLEGKATFLRSAHAVLDGFKDVAAARLVADQTRAVQWAVQRAAPEDTILIITDSPGQSAHQRRQDVQRLETVVEQARRGPAVRRRHLSMILPMPGVVQSGVSK